MHTRTTGFVLSSLAVLALAAGCGSGSKAAAPAASVTPTISTAAITGPSAAQIKTAKKAAHRAAAQARKAEHRAAAKAARKAAAHRKAVAARKAAAAAAKKKKAATTPVSNCTPGYSPCLAYHDGADYDCAGGSGNGPYYTESGVVYTVTGSDPYGLDSDGDRQGCE
jgi:hypothetical protein